MNKVTKKEKGFTIIEVVLVLAIAGLIFLTVFLALPALQKSQRDTQRKSDLGRAVSALQTYKSNHNGSMPSSSTDTNAPAKWLAFAESYLKNDSTFRDPTTDTDYVFTPITAAGPDVAATALGLIYIRTGYKCPTTGSDFVAGAGNNIALVVKLENGGSYCQGF